MDRQLSKAIDLLRYPMAVLVAMCHCGFLGGGATAAQIFFSETLPHVGKAARACPPLHRRGVTPCAVFRLTLCADNKMTPAGAVPAGDFFLVLVSVLAGGETKTTRKHDKGKKHSPLPRNGDGGEKASAVLSISPETPSASTYGVTRKAACHRKGCWPCPRNIFKRCSESASREATNRHHVVPSSKRCCRTMPSA